MADNDYERERDERIARNKAMLEQLQVAGTAQSMGRAAKSAADRTRKAPAKNSAEPGTGTPSRRSSRSGAAAARLKIKASVPVGGSSSDEDDDDDDEERPSSSRKRRKADLDDFYDPSDNGSSDEEGEEEEEEEDAHAGRRPSGKLGMMGNKEISTRARGGASSRDTRGGSTAPAAPARTSYQSHMKKLAGRTKTDEEEVDAAIARAVAATAVRRSPPVGTNAPADAVDMGRAPSRNRKASGRSRGAQMAAMAAGRKKATGKAPVVEEEDEDEVLEVSSGSRDEEDQDAAEDTDLQRAIAMSLGASDEGGIIRTEGQYSQEEAVAAGGSGGEEGRWAELPPEDISVRRVKRASGAKGANSSRPDVPEEGWKRVFLHLSHGRSTVTAKDIQKVSADLGHPAGDMDDDLVSMMLRRASELTGNGSSCLRMAEFLDLTDKMQASGK